MKKHNFIIIFLCLISIQAVATPKAKHINLTNFTKLVAYVPPGKGIRFTLPFLIKEQDTFAPFSHIITHPSFKYYRPEDGNSFNIWLPYNQPKDVNGNLFFNIAGYEVSVELRATDNTNKHISNYIFHLTKEKREELVQTEIKRRMAVLEQEHEEKLKGLDNQANNIALSMIGDLAYKGPFVKNVKEEQSVTLSGGDEIILYVDNMQTYKTFTVIPFELELKSRTKGAAVRSAKLFSKDINKNTHRLIKTASNIPKRIEPNIPVTGTITVFTGDIGKESKLSLQVVIEDTTVEVLW